MEITKYKLSPPSLQEIVRVLAPALSANYLESSVEVVPCPDLREAPFYLAAAGLTGDERIADVGGQPNLFPEPNLAAKYSLIDLAQRMDLPSSSGMLLGAGAGPFHVIGQNCELAPNLSWSGSYSNIINRTYYTKISGTDGTPSCEPSSSTDCALMANLFGCAGLPGAVLHITARTRRRSDTDGDAERQPIPSFTDCVRTALFAHYGETRPISMGGVFVVKRGTAYYHVMPDFPPREQLPWKSREQLNDWLTYHEFPAPMTCLTVFHSTEPIGEPLGLRMEHTHCFSVDESKRSGEGGGHYHYDVLPASQVDKEDDDSREGEIQYEAYFNLARYIYRIDPPNVNTNKDSRI